MHDLQDDLHAPLRADAADDDPDHDGDPDDDSPVEAYCVRCRMKVEIDNPEPVWTSKGAPGTRGDCPDCGATVFRMGMTQAHQALKRPQAVRVERGTKVKDAATGRKRAQPAIYLNFAPADREFALRLAAALENAGISTWIADPAGESPDVPWAGGIHPALKDSPRMIVVLSSAAAQNTAFSQAWRDFKSLRKPLVVITRDDSPVPDALRRSPRFVFQGDDLQAQQRMVLAVVAALNG